MHAAPQPGRAASGLLALFVHMLFFGLLLFGVNWQKQEVGPVFVEYWKELPPPPKSTRTKVEPKTAKVEPKSAKPAPKPPKRQLPVPTPVPTQAVV